MAGKTVDRVVAHPKLYMSVGGKLQHVKKGTPVTVSVAAAKKLGAKLVDPSQAEKLVDGKMVETSDNAMAEQLASAREGLEVLAERGKAQAEQLAALQAENTALKESDNVQATQQFAQKLAAEQETTKKLKAENTALKKAAKK